MPLPVFDPRKISPEFIGFKDNQTPESPIWTSLPTNIELQTPWILLFIYTFMPQLSLDLPEELCLAFITAPLLLPSKFMSPNTPWLLSGDMRLSSADRSIAVGFSRLPQQWLFMSKFLNMKYWLFTYSVNQKYLSTITSNIFFCQNHLSSTLSTLFSLKCKDYRPKAYPSSHKTLQLKGKKLQRCG